MPTQAGDTPQLRTRSTLVALGVVTCIFAFVLPVATDGASGKALAQEQEQGEEQDEKPKYDPEPTETELIVDSPFEKLEVACVERMVGEACFEAGRGWHEGRGIPRPNPLQAYHLYKAGCGFEYAPSCTAAATMILKAQAGFLILRPDGILSLDFGEAARLTGLACTFGDLASCGRYGDLMIDPDGQLPNEGTVHREIRQDPLAARQAYMDGCPLPTQRDLKDADRDPRSCGRLAQLYEEGLAGLRKNKDEALTYYRLGCAAGGDSNLCVKADLIDAHGLEPDSPPKKSLRSTRASIQPQRPAPDTSRFRDSPDALIDASGHDTHHRRFDLTLGVGARWTYGEGGVAGMKLRIGGVAWFNMVGLAFDIGFMADRFARIYDRTYLRFQLGLGPQLAIPIPDRLPQPIDFRIVLGVGGTVGMLKRGREGDLLLSYGIRQRVQLEVGNARRGGARQWGAIRFEQQQTWYADTGDTIEQASQVVLLGGFTFGGLDVDWTPKQH
jgi:TPR repeat protein